jgi:hypothetical protein
MVIRKLRLNMQILEARSAYLDLYYVVFGIIGSFSLIAAARGYFPRPGTKEMYLYAVALPLLAFHMLVIPNDVTEGRPPELSLAAHIVSGLPLNLSIFLALQSMLDAMGEKKGTRITFLCCVALGCALLLVFNPTQEVITTTMVLSILSLSLPLSYELRRR